jgi:cell wall-associated NlpC family hydrolase
VATNFDIVRAAVQVDARGGRYIFGAKGPKHFDCSGFTYEVGRLCGSNIGHGSKTQRSIVARARLEISVDLAMRTPGCLLFRMSGNPTHVAISLGNGSTIEAKGSKYGIGVFSAQGRRWSSGGYYPGIWYANPAAPPPAAPGVVDWKLLAGLIQMCKQGSVLSIGSSNSNCVKFAQTGINRVSGRGLTVDGRFGPATDRAVRDLQRLLHLKVDGVVGPETWRVLFP